MYGSRHNRSMNSRSPARRGRELEDNRRGAIMSNQMLLNALNMLQVANPHKLMPMIRQHHTTALSLPKLNKIILAKDSSISKDSERDFCNFLTVTYQNIPILEENSTRIIPDKKIEQADNIPKGGINDTILNIIPSEIRQIIKYILKFTILPFLLTLLC
jgi:hypothetical protein